MRMQVSMPSASTSTFIMLERVDVVLVPLDEGAFLHRGRARPAPSRSSAAGQNKPADMLRQMARKSDQFACQFDGVPHLRARRVEADLAQPLVRPKIILRTPGLRRQRRRCVLRQSHRPSHLACRHLWAVVDHRRGDAGAVPTVAFVDILDDFLAPFVLEIDVDVGRLAPFGGDEAFEQQVDLRGIDRGDAKAVAHCRIRRRTAPLAKNFCPRAKCTMSCTVRK